MNRLSLIIILTFSIFLHGRKLDHKFWLTTPKATIGITDRAWNYCDEKCLYLENYVEDTDFVVIYFKDIAFKPNFAACYAKKKDGSYQLWNKVIKNQFYEKLCGGDVDWLSLDKYEVTNVLGQGKGVPLKM